MLLVSSQGEKFPNFYTFCSVLLYPTCWWLVPLSLTGIGSKRNLILDVVWIQSSHMFTGHQSNALTKMTMRKRQQRHKGPAFVATLFGAYTDHLNHIPSSIHVRQSLTVICTACIFEYAVICIVNTIRKESKNSLQ